MAKKIVTVTAGSADWEPSKKELKKLRKIVERAVDAIDPKGKKVGAVLALRHGVYIDTIRVDD